MLIDIINFIFAYFISGLILGLTIQKFTKKAFDNKLAFLIGYGISPLLVSLILYYLYLFFPGKGWAFYAIIIYTFYTILLITSYKETEILHPKKILFLIKKIFQKTKGLDIFKKILLGFVLFVVVFTFVRNIFYPTTYTDAVKYLKQGFVYSQDHSHERLKSKESFSNFEIGNPLYGPNKEYRMNKAIRPALPIFYSFFYKRSIPTEFNFFSIRFIYSYYFLLSIFVASYIISRFKPQNSITGLTLLLSCYFFTKLSYSNYKAIITAFISITSLFLLYKIIKSKKWIYILSFGALCGLMSYINYTGLIISGILFLIGLFAFKTNFKRKILIAITIMVTFVFFSGGEINQYQEFIFKKKLLSFESKDTTFNSQEFVSRLEQEGKVSKEKNIKLDILITKKLQAFSQVQFFGFVFWLFLIILILTIISKKKLDTFSKINLSFIFIFFFIFSDPLFLNPHRFAYVLSICYKYTAILAVFTVLFITLNYDILINLFKKINLKYLKLAIVFCLLFLDPIRNSLVAFLMIIFQKTIILTNPEKYYLEKLNILLISVAILSLILFIFILIQERKGKQKDNKHFINLLFLFVFFILPFVFTLNNNQDIMNTFRYSFNKNTATQIKKVSMSQNEKNTFETIEYINKELDQNELIIIKNIPVDFNFWLYVKNNQRIFKEGDFFFQYEKSYSENFYILSSKESTETSPIKINCSVKKEFKNSILQICQKQWN